MLERRVWKSLCSGPWRAQASKLTVRDAGQHGSGHAYPRVGAQLRDVLLREQKVRLDMCPAVKTGTEKLLPLWIRIRLRGVEDEDISPGFVLTSPNKPVHAVRHFEAQLAILEHKNIICAGYSAVMHCHTLAEEVNLAVSGGHPDFHLHTDYSRIQVASPLL